VSVRDERIADERMAETIICLVRNRCSTYYKCI
jgi:hypothetical protein